MRLFYMNTGQAYYSFLTIAILYNYLRKKEKKYVTYQSRYVLEKAGAYGYIPKFVQYILIKNITPMINNQFSRLSKLTNAQIQQELTALNKKNPAYYGFVVNNS